MFCDYHVLSSFTLPQGERRPPLPTTHPHPILTFSAKEAGVALVASLLRARHGRVEPVERASVQPKGRSYSRTLFARGPDVSVCMCVFYQGWVIRTSETSHTV